MVTGMQQADAESPAVPGGLRARKRRETRRAIQAAALELCSAQGFERTRVEDIAALARVGVRTLYRYFPAKEDILIEADEDLLDALRREIASRPAEVGALEALHRFAERVADHYTENRAFMLRRHALFAATPVLARRASNYRPELVDALSEAWLHAVPGADPRRMRFAMAALGGAMDTAIFMWLEEGAKGPLNTLWREALEQLAPVLERAFEPCTGRRP